MVHFREVQRFRQPWLWIIVLASMTLVAWGAYQQLVLGRPFGNHPLSDRGLAVLILALLAFLLWVSQLALVIEVRDDEIDLHFRFLFTHRTIPIREVRSCEAVLHRPIVDYDAGGLRFSRQSRAYNISGNGGVQLELRDGDRLLISSQQPVELAHAIAERRAALSGG